MAVPKNRGICKSATISLHRGDSLSASGPPCSQGSSGNEPPHSSLRNVAVYLLGRTPLNTVPILSCVKAYSKNCHFRVFIMIKIGQTHVFLKDYVHIHQMGSHFVGGYQLDFSPAEQETKASILHSVVVDCCRRNKIKSSQISQFLIKVFFFFLQRYVEKGIRSAHPPQRIHKPRPFVNFFINQTSLVNIYVENATNLQSRAGRDFFGGVQPSSFTQTILIINFTYFSFFGLFVSGYGDFPPVIYHLQVLCSWQPHWLFVKKSRCMDFTHFTGTNLIIQSCIIILTKQIMTLVQADTKCLKNFNFIRSYTIHRLSTWLQRSARYYFQTLFIKQLKYF